jgi:hypothetical protein
MLMLTAIVLGLFSLTRLPVDLLPQLIYPEIGVRIIDPAVPANIMEDRSPASSRNSWRSPRMPSGVESTHLEGTARSLSCISSTARTSTSPCAMPAPGWIAPSATCRPASIRRASSSATRSQIPVLEFVVSSPLRDPVELRTWVDDTFAKWLHQPARRGGGEVGGGLVREVQVLPGPASASPAGLDDMDDIVAAIAAPTRTSPGGRLRMGGRRSPAAPAAASSRSPHLGLPCPCNGQPGGATRCRCRRSRR